MLCLCVYPDLVQLSAHLRAGHHCSENLHLLIQMSVAAAQSVNPQSPGFAIRGPGFFSPIPRPGSRMESPIEEIEMEQSFEYSTPSQSWLQSSDIYSSTGSSRTFSSGGYSSTSISSIGTSSSSTSTDSFQLLPELQDLEPIFSSFENSSSLLQSPPMLSSTPVEPRNKYPVPADLKQRIIVSNPGEGVEFVLSQRQNDQLVLNGYLLKKKKGPRPTRRGRTIHWRCVKETCKYSVTTAEGTLYRSQFAHNHPRPNDLVRKRILRSHTIANGV